MSKLDSSLAANEIWALLDVAAVHMQCFAGKFRGDSLQRWRVSRRCHRSVDHHFLIVQQVIVHKVVAIVVKRQRSHLSFSLKELVQTVICKLCNNGILHSNINTIHKKRSRRVWSSNITILITEMPGTEEAKYENNDNWKHAVLFWISL